jgi:hypothetical protein
MAALKRGICGGSPHSPLLLSGRSRWYSPLNSISVSEALSP